MNASDFTTYLREQVRNHSIYVWGAQGQKKPTITETWIRKREKTRRNADRAIAHWKKEVRDGYGDVLRAFDCSGLGTYFFLKNRLIDHDVNAEGLRALCVPISRSELREGDMTFRMSGGRAVHVGYAIDHDRVIEAKGRDVGVVESLSTKDGKRQRRQHEINFIVNLGLDKLYIQSSFEMATEAKAEQELLPLRKTGDSFRKLVITGDDQPFYTDENGISFVGIIPFLLDKSILSSLMV